VRGASSYSGFSLAFLNAVAQPIGGDLLGGGPNGPIYPMQHGYGKIPKMEIPDPIDPGMDSDERMEEWLSGGGGKSGYSPPNADDYWWQEPDESGVEEGGVHGDPGSSSYCTVSGTDVEFMWMDGDMGGGFSVSCLARVYRVDGPLTAWAPVDLLVGAA